MGEELGENTKPEVQVLCLLDARVGLQRIFACECTHTYTHTHIHTYTHTHIRPFFLHLINHLKTLAALQPLQLTYIHIHIHTYTHNHLRTYTHAHIHTQTHIHTHKHTHKRSAFTSSINSKYWQSCNTYTSIHTYTHVHTYTHTPFFFTPHQSTQSVRRAATHSAQTGPYTSIHTYTHTYTHTIFFPHLINQLKVFGELQRIALKPVHTYMHTHFFSFFFLSPHQSTQSARRVATHSAQTGPCPTPFGSYPSCP